MGVDWEGRLSPEWLNGYTSGMDSVRFGRTLGIGARLAAKTLVTAVDAATSPNPSSQGAPKKVEERMADKPPASRLVEMQSQDYLALPHLT